MARLAWLSQMVHRQVPTPGTITITSGEATTINFPINTDYQPLSPTGKPTPALMDRVTSIPLHQA